MTNGTLPTPNAAAALTAAVETAVKIGDQSFDLTKALDSMNYLILVSAGDSELMPKHLAGAIKGMRMIEWSDQEIADGFAKDFKATALKVHKEQSKVDHPAQFIATAKPKINDKSKPIDDIFKVMDAYVKALNLCVDTYNTANPDANLTHYTYTGGSVKSKAGGKGEERDYDILAKLIMEQAALWDDKTPMILTFDARKAVYPILIADGKLKIQYDGPTYATYYDTRAKDKTKAEKPSRLETGKQFELFEVTLLNTWLNGNVKDDAGKPDPKASPNSWITTKLKGITIPDGMTNLTIKDPTIAQFYDNFAPKDARGKGKADESEDTNAPKLDESAGK